MERIHPKPTQIEATTPDSIMDSETFPKFPYLPKELRDLMWKAAAETAEAAETPKVHAFSLRCPGPCAFCTDERTKSRPITLGFSRKALYRAPVWKNAWSYSDELNLPSHSDSALWNACPESRDVARRQSDPDKVVIGHYRTHGGDNQIITISPQADLILLDYPHLDRGRMDFKLPSPPPKWSPERLFGLGVGQVAIRFESRWLTSYNTPWGELTPKLDWVGWNELQYFVCAIHNVLGRVNKIWFVDYGLRRASQDPLVGVEDTCRQIFSANGGRFVEVRHYDMGWEGRFERESNKRHRLDAFGLTRLLCPDVQDRGASTILLLRNTLRYFENDRIPNLGVLAYEALN
jgi:hypothetical protein